MALIRQVKAQPVGIRKDEVLDLSQINHHTAKSVTASVQASVRSKGLQRVAGNIYICPSSKDFWKVTDGKIIRLIGVEVDNGESIAAPTEGNPGRFLSEALNDLTF